MTSLWKMAQITSKLKAVGQCGAARGHCPSAALLRRARDSTQLGESESRSDIPSSWDNDPGLWAQCQWALAGCQALPAPPHTSRLPVELEVRDCQGPWSETRDQGPAPGLAQAGASPWSLSHHRTRRHMVMEKAAERASGPGELKLFAALSVNFQEISRGEFPKVSESRLERTESSESR